MFSLLQLSPKYSYSSVFYSIQNLIMDHIFTYDWIFHELPFLKLISLLKNSIYSPLSYITLQLHVSLFIYKKKDKREKKEEQVGRKGEREDASFSSISNFFLVHCSVIKTLGSSSNETKYRIDICKVFLNQVVMYFSFQAVLIKFIITFY